MHIYNKFTFPQQEADQEIYTCIRKMEIFCTTRDHAQLQSLHTVDDYFSTNP